VKGVDGIARLGQFSIGRKVLGGHLHHAPIAAQGFNDGGDNKAFQLGAGPVMRTQLVPLAFAREAQRLARLGVISGAKTRKGTPCRNKSEAGKRCCKFHGGLSTVPKTQEGRDRIAEAQRLRWARVKEWPFDNGQ
jgi:hypothetical protein